MRRKTIFGLLITFLLPFVGFGFTYGDLEKAIITNPLFDPTALQEQNDIYSFDNAGQLRDGPVRADGEPIDYSSLILEGYLEENFERSVYYYNDTVRYCEDMARKYDSKNISVLLVQENSIDSEKFEDVSKNTIDQNFEPLQFSWFLSQNQEDADLVIYVGTVVFLVKEMQRDEDEYALDYVEHWQGLMEQPQAEDQTSGAIDLAQKPFCYSSDRDWGKLQRMKIYVNSSGAKACFSRVLLDAIGLKPRVL